MPSCNTKHPKKKACQFFFLVGLPTDLCLKVCHWAVCVSPPPPPSLVSLTPVTLEPIAYPRNMLLTKEVTLKKKIIFYRYKAPVRKMF